MLSAIRVDVLISVSRIHHSRSINMSKLSPNYPDNGSPPMQLEELLSAAKPAPAAQSSRSTHWQSTRLVYRHQSLSQCAALWMRQRCAQWSEWFQQAGFQNELLLDEQATRQQILSSISTLVQSAAAGDVVAIQYSGHGTQLPDLDGDELDGDTRIMMRRSCLSTTCKMDL